MIQLNAVIEKRPVLTAARSSDGNLTRACGEPHVTAAQQHPVVLTAQRGTALASERELPTTSNMLHHLSFVVTDLAKSAAFYDAALATLGYGRVWEDATFILNPGFRFHVLRAQNHGATR